MKKSKQLVIGFAVAGILAVHGGSVAQAHNAGHIILPGEECLNVGSGKSVTPESENNPNINVNGELDLNPATPTRDEVGARHAADQGNSEVLPGHCPP